MPVEVIWEVRECVDGLGDFLSGVADACFAAEGVPPCSFCVRIVDKEAIRALNRDLRNVDSETDVLSFPAVRFPRGRTARDCPKRLMREYDPASGMIQLGDCALCLDRAREQAAELGHALRREMGYLTAHSAFHLMGYDHMTEPDKRAMRAMEKQAMAQLRLYREEARDMTDQALYEGACEALRLAYAPYSNYQVGACLLADSGETYLGANIENSSYGATICAERCAVANAVAHGEKRFTAIGVVGSTSMGWPCGICRQVLSEFAAGGDMRVVVGQRDGIFEGHMLSELLPHAFTPAHLDIKP